MEVKEEDRNRIDIFTDKSGKKEVEGFNALIYAESGGGKTLASSAVVEELHDAGFLVIHLSDTKKKTESGYCAFPPTEQYHLDILRKIGKNPSSKEIKLYHPFTFRLPRHKIPNHRFFTLPLKSLTRDHLSMLLETKGDTYEINLILDALDEMKPSDDIPQLMQIIEERINQKHDRIGSERILEINEPYYTRTTVGGTRTNLEAVQTKFKPFEKDYFFTSHESPLNLDAEEIFKDQKAYHVLETKYIQDKKMYYFVVLSFLKMIMNNINKCKYPICFVIEEVNGMFPREAKAYQEFLASIMLDELLTWRNKGKYGVNSVLTAQSYVEMSDEVKVGFNETFLGTIGSIKDIGNLSKELRLKRDISDRLRLLPRNYFFRMKSLDESDNAFMLWFPSHCHSERGYDFDEMWFKYNESQPDKYPVLTYEAMNELLHKMKEFKLQNAKVAKERATKIRQAEISRAKEIEQKKIDREDKRNEVIAKTSEIKQQNIISKQEKMKLIWEEVNEAERSGQKRPSFRELAKKFGIDHKTASNYFKEYDLQQKANSQTQT